jgi:hypothetical protein
MTLYQLNIADEMEQVEAFWNGVDISFAEESPLNIS